MMQHFSKNIYWALIVLAPLGACKKTTSPPTQSETITVTNVLKSEPLVESGTFQGTGAPALIMPGQSVTIKFSAAKGEALSFATMYGWSNDLFFAPVNPGIAVYDSLGNPIQGGVSAQGRPW